jgi:peroxiredoxin
VSSSSSSSPRSVLAFGVAFAAVAAAAAGAPRAIAAGPPRAGDKAPAFTLRPVDKGEARALGGMLKGRRTRGLVLAFVSSRCPYVVQARQQLADFARRYGERIFFVGVNANQDEDMDDVKADAARNFPFPVLRDEGAKVAELYGATRTPELFLVDDDGVIRYHGGMADLEAALGDLLANRPIAKAESRAFGCSIKRGK